jgi:transposase-like protein
MNSPRSPYRGYRFPPEIISYCVWLYFRFSVSYRDIEELMAERGVTVTYETIRAWCYKFGQDYAKRIRVLSRWGCTRISRTLPSWSTARHKYIASNRRS